MIAYSSIRSQLRLEFSLMQLTANQCLAHKIEYIAVKSSNTIVCIAARNYIFRLIRFKF